MKIVICKIAVCTVVSGISCVSALSVAAKPRYQATISSARDGQQSSETDELVRTAVDLYRQGKFDEALVALRKAAQ